MKELFKTVLASIPCYHKGERCTCHSFNEEYAYITKVSGDIKIDTTGITAANSIKVPFSELHITPNGHVDPKLLNVALLATATDVDDATKVPILFSSAQNPKEIKSATLLKIYLAMLELVFNVDIYSNNPQALLEKNDFIKLITQYISDSTETVQDPDFVAFVNNEPKKADILMKGAVAITQSIGLPHVKELIIHATVDEAHMFALGLNDDGSVNEKSINEFEALMKSKIQTVDQVDRIIDGLVGFDDMPEALKTAVLKVVDNVREHVKNNPPKKCADADVEIIATNSIADKIKAHRKGSTNLGDSDILKS